MNFVGKSLLVKALRVFAVSAILLMGLPNMATATTLNSALDKYRIGDFREAIEQWEYLARMGNPDALFNLGQVYRLGKGVNIDMAKVEYFYRRAAESGHTEAQNNLATLYYFNESNQSRRGEALTWWRLAARRGHGTSQYMLAILHYNGQYVPKDNIQAYAWVLLAKDAGVEEAVAAEHMMLREFSDNELNQGRLLSRGLVDVTIDAPDLHLTIPDPLEPQGTVVPNSPPLVVDSPQTPPEPPKAKAVENKLKSPPTPPSPTAPPVAKTLVQERASETIKRIEGWAVQLGSFRNIKNPRALIKAIEAKAPSLIDGLTSQIAEADLGEKGVFYRLIIGPFTDKASAKDRCEQLKASGFNCFITKP